MVTSLIKRNQRFIKFLIVGLGYNAATYALYSLLLFLGLNYLIASTLSYIFGTILSYFMNKHLVFGSQQREAYLLVWYFGYYLLLLGISLFLLYGLVTWFGINPYLAQIIIALISAGVSYQFSRLLFLRVHHGLFNTRRTRNNPL